MSEWRTYKISEVYEGLYDGPHATPPDSDTGAIFLGISNITPGGRLDFSDIKHISEYDLPKWTKRVVPTEGDIVFSYEATLNLYAMIPKGFWGCLGRRMALIRPDNSKAYGRFLYYYFFSPQWRATIQNNTVVGATVDRIPIARFPDFPVTIPDLGTQHRIADILSTYDFLIETNQRQIKLLEEAAQRLYREWFVDLRFPGHEDVPVVDGVPEGWSIQTIANIASVNCDAVGKDWPYATIDYIDISSVTQGQIGSKTTYEVKDAPGRARRIAHDGDIIWSMVRPNLRAYALVQYPDKKNVFSTGFAVLSARKVPFPFLYCSVTTDDFVGYLVNCTNGAAYPAVKPIHFEQAKITVPSMDVLQKFERLTLPMFREIHYLSSKNNRLSEARDRLLPKLMSSEIAV